MSDLSFRGISCNDMLIIPYSFHWSLVTKFLRWLTGTIATVTVSENLTLFLSPFSFLGCELCCVVDDRMDEDAFTFCRAGFGGNGKGSVPSSGTCFFIK